MPTRAKRRDILLMRNSEGLLRSKNTKLHNSLSRRINEFAFGISEAASWSVRKLRLKAQNAFCFKGQRESRQRVNFHRHDNEHRQPTVDHPGCQYFSTVALQKILWLQLLVVKSMIASQNPVDAEIFCNTTAKGRAAWVAVLRRLEC